MSQRARKQIYPWLQRFAIDVSTRAMCASRVITCTLSLVAATASEAQFVVTEGKGYTLCEQVTAHVNRLTDSGKAKRLWHYIGSLSHNPRVVPYPQAQSYLTPELTSFPGFKRPAFTEIKLEEVRPLIELMGEIDAFSLISASSESPRYQDRSNYIAERKLGTAPPEVVEKLRPHGKWLYERLELGRARVFKLAGIEYLAPETILQIEYTDFRGEPVSLLRYVSNGLTEPRVIDNTLDSALPGVSLVMWAGGYYRIYATAASSFEIESRIFDREPNLCRVENRYRPKDTQSKTGGN